MTHLQIKFKEGSGQVQSRMGDGRPCNMRDALNKSAELHAKRKGFAIQRASTHLPSASPKLMPSASLPPTTHSMTAPLSELPPPPPALLPPPWLPLLFSACAACTAGLPALPSVATALLPLPPPPPPPLLLAPLALLPPAAADAMQSAYSVKQASTSPAERGSRNTRFRAASWRSSPLACHLQERLGMGEANMAGRVGGVQKGLRELAGYSALLAARCPAIDR